MGGGGFFFFWGHDAPVSFFSGVSYTVSDLLHSDLLNRGKQVLFEVE
jgi:hypothetical protein